MRTKIKKKDLDLALKKIPKLTEWLTLEVSEGTENFTLFFEDGFKYSTEITIFPATRGVTPQIRQTKNLYEED